MELMRMNLCKALQFGNVLFRPRIDALRLLMRDALRSPWN